MMLICRRSVTTLPRLTYSKTHYALGLALRGGRWPPSSIQNGGGKFLDELESQGLFDHLEAQCAATVRSKAPTYFRHGLMPAYARIALPLWGNGRIEMLLVAAAATGGR
jgi:hypothetical protein